MTPRLTPLCLAFALALGVVTGACGSKESSGPAVVPGAAAGDVKEVTGTVTAQRGDEPARTLAVGDVVSGDDLIKTEANSSIVIELRHNGVRWSLAAQHAKRLGDSAAWKAPKREEGGATGERSTAAGRHAEREAADTAATAETAAVEVNTPAPAAAAEPVQPPEPVPPPAPKEDPAPREEVRDKPRRTADRPKPASGGGGEIKADETIDDLRTQEKRAVEVEVTARLGNASTPDAKKVIAQQLGPLKACWQRAVEGGASGGGQFAVSLTVDADGKVTDVDTKADAAVERAAGCLVDRFKAMTFAAGAEGVITATLSFGIE
jgi:hypothetical protein